MAYKYNTNPKSYFDDSDSYMNTGTKGMNAFEVAAKKRAGVSPQGVMSNHISTPTDVTKMPEVNANNQYNFMRTPEQNMSGTANVGFNPPPVIPDKPIMPPNMNAPLSQISNQYGNIVFDKNGMPTLVEDPDKTAKSYTDMKLAEAAKEALRRQTEAQNLYNSSIGNLDIEQLGVDPRYQDTIETIGKESFNTGENAKELMNMYGWNMGNSGLAIGEVDKIGIQKDKDLAKAKRDRDIMLADIARRKATAASLRDSGVSSAKDWQAAQTMGAEAEGFLKGKETFKGAYDTMRKNWVENASVDQVKASTDMTKSNTKSIDTTTDSKLEQLAREKEDYTKKNYRDSVINRGENMDYSAEINKVRDDGDPTNDWQMGILEEGKQNKLNTRKKTFNESVMQYYDDASGGFQNAINNLDPNDPLYGYKKGVLMSNQQVKKNALQKSTSEKVKEAMDIWKQRGVADENIARILGVEPGAKTSDYIKTENDTAMTNYNTGKPYYNPNTGSGSGSKLTNDSRVSSAYADFTATGLSFDEWNNSLINDGIVLTPAELKAVSDLAKTTGKFDSDTQLLNQLMGKTGR